MARTVTKADLRLRARRMANMEFSDFIEDSDFDAIVSQAYTDLVDELAKNAIHLFEVTDTIVTDGVTNTYDLPDDFYRMLALEYSIGECMYGVEEVAFVDRNHVRTPLRGYARGYRVVGDQIVLYPPQLAANTYTIVYVPAPADLTDMADDTIVNGIAGWDELIVTMAAMDALRREGSDVSDLEKKEFKLRARIREAAANLAQGVHRRGGDRDRYLRFGLDIDGVDDGEFWGDP
jgi:hypothetical protein